MEKLWAGLQYLRDITKNGVGEIMTRRTNVAKLEDARPLDGFSITKEEKIAFDEEMHRRTFSLQRKWLKYIDSVSVKLTVERGKSVSASEALRVILAEHEAK